MHDIFAHLKLIVYHNFGPRYYHDAPVASYARGVWELQVRLEGDMFPIPFPAPKPGPHIWLFRPECVHGWTSSGASETVVWHFDLVPTVIQNQMPRSGLLHRGLNLEEVKSFAQYRNHHKPKRRNDLFIMDEEVLSLELLRTFLAGLPRHQVTRRRRTDIMVRRCLGWYAANLERDPNLDEVAASQGMSVASLRRLFHEVMKRSPQEIFNEERIRRAEIHLANGANVETTSQLCGYASPSSFSRAFKKARGISPVSARRSS